MHCCSEDKCKPNGSLNTCMWCDAKSEFLYSYLFFGKLVRWGHCGSLTVLHAVCVCWSFRWLWNGIIAVVEPKHVSNSHISPWVLNFSRVVTSQPETELAADRSTVTNLQMRTSPWSTPVLESCPWQMLAPTLTAPSSSSALPKLNGKRASWMSSQFFLFPHFSTW